MFPNQFCHFSVLNDDTLMGLTAELMKSGHYTSAQCAAIYKEVSLERFVLLYSQPMQIIYKLTTEINLSCAIYVYITYATNLSNDHQ